MSHTHDGVRVRRSGDGFRYFHSSGGREFSCRHPYILELEITWRCNLSCPHCYVDAGPDAHGTAELTLEEIRSLLSDARQAGMQELSLTGGEVCCRPDLEGILAAGREAGFPVRLVTSATLVDASTARAWKNAGVILATVSVDGMDPQVHDAIRGPGMHAATMEGIRLLREAGVPVSIISAFSRINVGELPALWDWALRENLTLQVQMVSAKGRAGRDLILSPEEYYELGLQVAGFFEKHPHRIVPMDDLVTCSNRHPLSLLARTWQKRCTGGILNLFVRANGDVTPCSALALPENVVGNIRDPGGLARILEEERCRENLSWLHADHLEGVCGECPHAPSCHGGCPDILLTMCQNRLENEYCYHRLERRELLEALLELP